MKFLDLFAGIGGFRMGLESLGHECVGFCEIDKFARKSYKAIYDTKGEIELHDITQVTNQEWRKLRGAVDIVCGGFPCQAFSIAGKRKGFLDETRGTLFFEIARAAKEIQPPLLFLENVKGLLSHDQGRTFRTILSTLDELGYDAEWQVLNSKDFGVPQNRERVYIVGHLRGECARRAFPIFGESGTVNQAGSNVMVIDDQGRKNKKISPKNIVPTLRAQSHGNEPKVAIPVLTPDRANKRQNGRRFKTDREPMFTLTAQDRHGVMVLGSTQKNAAKTDGTYCPALTSAMGMGGGHVPMLVRNKIPFSIRKLTPRECWRLQGFPDWAFDKAQEVNSNSQLYKQAGNSVTVNVIKAIAERLEK